MPGRPSPTINLDPVRVRRKTAQQLLGLGKTYVDDLIAKGILEAVKIGDARNSPVLISYESIKAYRGRPKKLKPAEGTPAAVAE